MKYKFYFFVLGTLFSGILYAQKNEKNNSKNKDSITTESVIVVKTYNPTINDAFKINTPAYSEDTQKEEKPSLKYNINSIPVASTFSPQKAASINVQKEKIEKTYTNYARLGGGNFGNINAELFTNFSIDRESYVTAFLQHQSSQGGIKDVKLDDHFYDTSLQLVYDKQTKHIQWSTDLEIQHQQYNWYGLSEKLVISDTDLLSINPVQNYFDINIGGSLQLDNEIFKGGVTRLRYFKDDFGSTETNLIIKPKIVIPLNDYEVLLPAYLDYVSGNSDSNTILSENKYSVLNFEVHPSLPITLNDIDVNIGFSGAVSADFDNKKTRLFAYPNITANYRFIDYGITAFGGITGGLTQNTYHKAVTKNVYIAPAPIITPTSEAFKLNAGIKGVFFETIGYEVEVAFKREKDKPFYRKLPILNTGNESLPFGFNNAFTYVYDDVKTTNASFKIHYDSEGQYGLGLGMDLATYKTDELIEAWNLPTFQSTINGYYFINSKLKVGTELFFVGKREAFDQFTGVSTSLKSYFDVNLKFDYKINKQWFAYIQGNNLTNQDYERWLDYPVQGIQFLGGVKYLFNW